MMAMGLFLLVVGAMALAGAVLQRMRAGRLGDTPFAPSGQVAANGRGLASPKGAIATQGTLRPMQMLTSPISGAPCVYYRMRVEATWTENNVEQKYTVLEDAQAAPFAVDDGSGPVTVVVDPKVGGEFCATKPFEGKKFSRGLLAAMGSKPLEVTAHFSIPASVQVRGALGRMIDVPTTATFLVSEEYLEPKALVYVNGKLRDDGAIGAPDWASLLVLDRSRDELLASTQGFSKKLFLGGGIAAPVGAILAVVGHLTAPPPTTAPAALTAPATDNAANAATPTPAPTPSPVTSTLTATGACAELNLSRGQIHIANASDGISIVAMEGTSMQRVFVKLGAVQAGDTVEVCQPGRRCAQLLQVGVGATTYVNNGRATSGSVVVESYDVASGRMSLTFRGVTLTQTNGDARCVVDGSLSTTGLVP